MCNNLITLKGPMLISFACLMVPIYLINLYIVLSINYTSLMVNYWTPLYNEEPLLTAHILSHPLG